MTEPLNDEYANHMLEAIRGVKRLVLDPATELGYVSKTEVPAYKENKYGWPSISRSYFGSDGPMSWSSLFSPYKGSGNAKFDPTDVPELELVIDYVLANEDLRAKIAGIGVPKDDSEASRALDAADVIRVVARIAERSEATGEDIYDVFIQHERALLAPTLSADLLAPIALVRLDLEEPLELGEDVWIEPLDESTQRARAVDIHSGVNAFLVSAATHAVVLRNLEFDNSRGPLYRRLFLEMQPQYLREIEEAFQALEIASEQRVGYVQMALRPHGWADEWRGDLPPVQSVATMERLPLELASYGWNEEQQIIPGDKVAKVSETFVALRATHTRGKLAARRLFQSSLRSVSEDTLLDACIGIEALLGEEHDELSHRMGLRASVALAPRGVDATLAYDLLKKVYSHRSKIVHGTESKNSTIDVKGSAYSADSVAVYLLRKLLKAHLHQTPSWKPADLDKILMSTINGQLSPEETSDQPPLKM